MVSVIITSYDRPELLQRAVKSVLAQTLKDYELIVVDDCSPTPSLPGQYQLIRHTKNKGLSATRNTGIRAAKGEYIVCLDDDNELMPEFLARTVAAIGNHDAVAVGRVIQYKDFAHYAPPALTRFTAIDWGWLIKKSVFDSLKYDEALKANEDADFGILFFKRFKAKVLPQPLTIAHDCEKPEDSLSFPTRRELGGITYFLVKNIHHYAPYPDELRYLYRLAGRKFYRGGYRLKGLGYFWRSFLAKPGIKSATDLFFILWGWTVYDIFMTLHERKNQHR